MASSNNFSQSLIFRWWIVLAYNSLSPVTMFLKKFWLCNHSREHNECAPIFVPWLTSTEQSKSKLQIYSNDHITSYGRSSWTLQTSLPTLGTGVIDVIFNIIVSSRRLRMTKIIESFNWFPDLFNRLNRLWTYVRYRQAFLNTCINNFNVFLKCFLVHAEFYISTAIFRGVSLNNLEFHPIQSVIMNRFKLSCERLITQCSKYWIFPLLIDGTTTTIYFYAFLPLCVAF